MEKRRNAGRDESSLTSSYIIRHGRSNGIWSLRISIGKKHPGCTESPYVTISLTLSSASIHHSQNNIPRGYANGSSLNDSSSVAISLLFRVRLKTALRTDHAYLSRPLSRPLPAKSRTGVSTSTKLRSIQDAPSKFRSLGLGIRSCNNARHIPISMTPGRRGVPLFRVSTLWCVLLFYQ